MTMDVKGFVLFLAFAALSVCAAQTTPDANTHQGVSMDPITPTTTNTTGDEQRFNVTFEEEEYTDDPEANPGYYEGDITMPSDRNAVKYSQQTWPSGVVPYLIHSSYPTSARDTILTAMREIEADTKHGSGYCVRFVPKTTHDTTYIYVVPQDGCHSPVGRHSGRGIVSIGNGCEQKGTIMHELLHTLGFYHEQNRYDRDSYVDINYSNVPTSRTTDFAKLTSAQMTTLGTPYDYSSIMHYSAYIFALDPSKPTVTPKPNLAHGQQLGQRLRLSTLDVKRIQTLYHCPVDTNHIAAPTRTQLVVDCTFESGFCNMIQDSHDDFQWSRRRGATPTHGTGPNADHTNGVGYYVYTESNRHTNKYARLKSPNIAAGTHCVSFAIFDYGSNMGQFNVNIEGSRIVPQTVKRWTGSQKNQWVNVKITLTSPATWDLVFESHIGTGTHSDIALDDIQVYGGRC